VLLPVLLFRDERVFSAGNLTLSFSLHRLATPLVGAHGDDRQLPLEIRSTTRRTTRNITGANQRFEFVTAAPTVEIVKRHVVPLRQSVTFSDDKLYA